MLLFSSQEDENLLGELFTHLTDKKTDAIRQKELVLFLKELCTFAQALQPPGRESFFKTMNSLVSMLHNFFLRYSLKDISQSHPTGI
jgi:hypothetical protein